MLLVAGSLGVQEYRSKLLPVAVPLSGPEGGQGDPWEVVLVLLKKTIPSRATDHIRWSAGEHVQGRAADHFKWSAADHFK